MKTKIIFFTICTLVVNSLAFSQSINLTLGSGGVFTLKDASANYLTLSQSTGEVNILKNLRMENTANSTTGVLFKGTERFIHNYGVGDIFIGLNSGNFTTTGGYNVAIGNNALTSITLGSENTAVGESSLNKNTTGGDNSAFGLYSLKENTTGYGNTAIGCLSLRYNTTGISNIAVGFGAMYSNTTGSTNTVMGNNSLSNNTIGYNNTAMGYQSMNLNISGYDNTAVGRRSLYSNTTGINNASFGLNSLYTNSTGNNNTALGYSSLYSNTVGTQNTALGSGSLLFNINGNNNTALGLDALNTNVSGFNNTAVGNISLFNNTGNYNTALGYNAGSTITTGANLTCIGIDAAPSSPTAFDQVTLGNGFVTSLRCNVQTITSLSDARDKKNVSELSFGLDFITKLHPRQFNWDKREWYDDNVSDGSKMKDAPTAGFIAQELDSAQTTAGAEWLNLVLKDNPEKWEATYGNLLPVMVKAIQELKTENDELKDKLAKFEEMQSVLAGEIEKMKSNNNSIKEVRLTEK